jgi:alkanesulfonate monooxygenase SsuD/methylene tetrahydromethanopterin reductase-like flavin-dependent oxidoreductase (luciferase family)
LDYGVHLPVIDFGFHRFSLERLCAYVRRAEELGFEAVSTNDHLIHSRPWLDAPISLAAVLSHTGKMAVGTSVALPVVRAC